MYVFRFYIRKNIQKCNKNIFEFVVDQPTVDHSGSIKVK